MRFVAAVVPRDNCRKAPEEVVIAPVPLVTIWMRFGVELGVIASVGPVVSATKVAEVVVPAVDVVLVISCTTLPGFGHVSGGRQICKVVGPLAHVPAVPSPEP